MDSPLPADASSRDPARKFFAFPPRGWAPLGVWFVAMLFLSPSLRPRGQAPGPPAPDVHQLPDGSLRIGGVRLDPARRRLQFEGSVNMSRGLVEYLLVHSSGKVHESVLRTEVRPLHIHLAALLLAGVPPNAGSGLPAATNPPALPPADVWVSWQTGAVEHRVRAEQLIFNLKSKALASPGAWTYTGSRLVAGNFIAERDGSIVAVYTDPDSLLNNPRPGSDDDEIWEINTNLVAAVGTPVRVEILFPKPAN